MCILQSKNKKKKKKKKKAKSRKQEEAPKIKIEEIDEEDDVEVEYVQETLDIDASDPAYLEFQKIFETFKVWWEPAHLLTGIELCDFSIVNYCKCI